MSDHTPDTLMMNRRSHLNPCAEDEAIKGGGRARTGPGGVPSQRTQKFESIFGGHAECSSAAQ